MSGIKEAVFITEDNFIQLSYSVVPFSSHLMILSQNRCQQPWCVDEKLMNIQCHTWDMTGQIRALNKLRDQGVSPHLDSSHWLMKARNCN